MQYLILALLIIAFSAIIARLKFLNFSTAKLRLLIFLFCLKFLLALGINQYYENRYRDEKFSDIHKYFNDGIGLKNIAFQQPFIFLKLFLGIADNSNEFTTATATLKNWKEHTSEYLSTLYYKDSNLFSSQRTLIRINALIGFISINFIPIHTIIFTFLGFFGTILIFHSLLLEKVKNSFLILCILILLPSSMLWSSTIHKESLVLFSLGIILFCWVKKNLNYKYFLGFVLGCILLLYTSYHLLFCFFLAWGLSKIFLKGKLYFLLSLFFLGGVLTILTFTKKTNPLIMLSSKFNQQNKIGRGGYYFENKEAGIMYFIEEKTFHKMALQSKNTQNPRIYFLPSNTLVFPYEKGKIKEPEAIGAYQGWYYMKLHYESAESYLTSNDLNPDFSSFLLFLPKALSHIFIFPKNKILQLKYALFAFESLLLLCLFIYLVWKQKFAWSLNSNELFLLLFTFLSFFIIAYTTPILGNIVRYKTPGMVCFAFFLIQRLNRVNETQ